MKFAEYKEFNELSDVFQLISRTSVRAEIKLNKHNSGRIKLDERKGGELERTMVELKIETLQKLMQRITAGSEHAVVNTSWSLLHMCDVIKFRENKNWTFIAIKLYEIKFF